MRHSLLVLAVFVGVPSAMMGAVIQSPLPPTVVPNTLDGLYINVVTGQVGTSGGSVAGWDFNPYTKDPTSIAFLHPLSNGVGVMRWISAPSLGYVANVPLGTSINATRRFGWTGTGALLAFFDGIGEDWVLNGSNYFGFSFLNERTSAVHYGWGQMDVGANPGVRTLMGLWYEDRPGVGIAAGAGLPIPEPSTAVLLVLGCAGVAALRRRSSG